jgi:hypothetical protein
MPCNAAPPLTPAYSIVVVVVVVGVLVVVVFASALR